MKSGIHPISHPALFIDGEYEWTGITTQSSDELREIDGIKHHVIHVEISAFTHPLYTGQKKIVDTAGRVEKFRRRYAKQLEGK